MPTAWPRSLAALAGRAGDVVVFPLWPSGGAPGAKRVIVAARKGGRGAAAAARAASCCTRPDGRFTAAAEAILRDGGAACLLD